MDTFKDLLTGFASAENHPLGLALLAASAAVEYVFPPFPGDTMILLGAVLITAYGWSFWLVLLAGMIGSAVGSMATFWLGDRLRLRRERRRATGEIIAERATLDVLIQRFHRHGPIYLVLNRFVPGIRPFFFIAAGMAGMRARAVLFYGSLSALLWNLALIALGALLGANLEALLDWVGRYSLIAGGLLVAVVGFFVIRWWRRRPH